MKLNFLKWESVSRFLARDDMVRFSATNQKLQKLTTKIEFGNPETQPIRLMNRKIATDSQSVWFNCESIGDVRVPGKTNYNYGVQDARLESASVENINHFANIETGYGLSRDSQMVPPPPL